MSINYKKMSDMIVSEIKTIPSLSSFQIEKLARLSNKIYAIESSVDDISSQRIIDDIKNEISLATSDFYGNGAF